MDSSKAMYIHLCMISYLPVFVEAMYSSEEKIVAGNTAILKHNSLCVHSHRHARLMLNNVPQCWCGSGLV